MLESRSTGTLIVCLALLGCGSGGESGAGLTAARLEVTPVEDYSPVGMPGGPFVPASTTYLLRNTGDFQLDWTASGSDPWILCTPDTGRLEGGSDTAVTVTIDPARTASMPLGVHEGRVTFSDPSSGAAVRRSIRLALGESPALQIGPGSLAATGAAGGPFDQHETSFGVRNAGARPIHWSVRPPPWLVATPASGTLTPGAETSVAIALDRRVTANFTPGTYAERIFFVDATNSTVVERPVSLTILNTTGGGYEVPVLEPGSGFVSPTPEPAPVGSGPGLDAKVIAHWNVVPRQRLSSEFTLGVAAFHTNGIDRVEFSLEGGPWARASAMTRNPRTDTYEYWCRLDPTLVPDGRVEIRAVAYPNAGVPRVLEPLPLFCDANGTLPAGVVHVALSGDDDSGDGSTSAPFRTISRAAWALHQHHSTGRADGGTILLHSGDHEWGPPPDPSRFPLVVDEWLTVAAAPGVDRSDVRIVDSGNLGSDVNFVHIRDLTVTVRINSVAGGTDAIWVENVEFVGSGTDVRDNFVDHLEWEHKYYTGTSLWRDTERGPGRVTLARDLELRNLGHDAFQDAFCVINCKVRGIAPIFGAHPDLYQAHYGGAGNTMENILIYGLEAYDCDAQLIFTNNLDRLDGIAFVNVVAEKSGSWNLFSQWLVPTNHLLLWNVTLDNQALLWRNASAVRNVSVIGSIFEGWGAGTPVDSQFVHNHWWTDTITAGVGVSLGDPGFKNASFDDYTPSASSVLRSRIANPPVPHDVRNTPRGAMATVGAIE